MFPLPEKFDPNGPISQIPREWFEMVAKVLNHCEMANGTIIKTSNPSAETPWIFDAGASGGGTTLPPSAGNSGKVLTVTDALGTLAWMIASSMPPVDASDAGKVPQVNAEGQWVEGPALPTAPAVGDMLAYNGTRWVSVPKATSNNAVLTYATATNTVSWQPLSGVNAQLPGVSGGTTGQVLTLSGAGKVPTWDWLRAT